MQHVSRRTWLPVCACSLGGLGGLGGLGVRAFLQLGLVLPPQLVESSYELLAESLCIPRRWHVDGRHGVRVARLRERGRDLRLVPLRPGCAEQDLPPGIRELLRAHRAQLIDLKKEDPKKNSASETVPSARTAAVAATPASGAFRFAELFAGIGGFRVGLEALGGTCAFASEIEPFTREVYDLNFPDGPSVYGDIRAVSDAEIPEVDIVVGGFPCQPFSALGTQPAFNDGRGLLFHEIVRVLRASHAKAFLLENVPGLLNCDEGRALQAIVGELRLAGYEVFVETVNARALTAQARKRVFFFGFRDVDTSNFSLPFIPDLQLRARDILEPESELQYLEDYTLSEEHFERLRTSRKWSQRGGMTETLAWADKVCATLVAHYGTSIAKGNSQLVPRCAPHPPRRFSVRECARLMGFPDTFRLTEPSMSDPGRPAWFRSLYKMLGNSVSPPLVAVLASALRISSGAAEGQSAALRLALGAVAPHRRPRLLRALHPSWQSAFPEKVSDIGRRRRRRLWLGGRGGGSLGSLPALRRPAMPRAPAPRGAHPLALFWALG
ncbi:unnamed protein product [Effrenium voratum]|nr:unnamed protein product [Effrenium voratum]